MKNDASRPDELLPLVRASSYDTMCQAPLLVEWDPTFDYERPSPHGSARAPDLLSCIDFAPLNDVFENFLGVTGLPIAIIDLNARVLASSRWHRLCMNFHRVNPDTLAGCIKSDTVLSRQVQEGRDVAIYRCANGLTDCATPITIDGCHVANLFIGQFLLAEPDMAFFKSQQERYGFDESGYFEALSGIPIVSEQRIPAILKLLRGLAQQIAHQSLAESKWQAATQMLQTVIDNVPHDVFWKDSESRYLGCNQNVARMAGVASVQDIVGRTDDDLPWRKFAAAYREDDAQIMKSGVARNKIVEPRELDGGSIRWLETSKVPLKNANGRVFGILGLSQDITERIQADAELARAKDAAEQANDAKSRFLAAVSHDLRQPLSALSLYLRTLENKLPPTEKGVARDMQHCLTGLNELLSDLLDLSKLEAGVVRPTIGDFSLDSILERVGAALGPLARRKRLAFRMRGTGAFGRTDRVLFQRILMNLVSNAIRYTDAGGILIARRRRKGKTWLEVWDTGVGIPADRTTEIFEEFRQLGNHERNREKGTGIGLTIVAKTAALLGLEVQVRSCLRKGSVFSVEVPPGARVCSKRQEPRKASLLTISLIEDNADVAKALAYALEAQGHKVLVSVNLTEAIEKLSGSVPDIVISDYRLSGSQNGYDVITAMRAYFEPHLPAMLITGDTDPEIIRYMAQQGVVVHHKPLDMDRFFDALADLTGGESAVLAAREATAGPVPS